MRGRKNQFQFWKQLVLIQLPRFDKYANARHYEIFVIEAYLRQSESQDLHYNRDYNYRYQYNLLNVQIVAPGLHASETFIVRLTIHGRKVIGRPIMTRDPYWEAPKPFAFSTQVLHTNAGLLYPNHETLAPPLPEVDSDGMISPSDVNNDVRALRNVSSSRETLGFTTQDEMRDFVANNLHSNFSTITSIAFASFAIPHYSKHISTLR